MTLLSKNAELVGFRLALLAIVCWSSAFLVARFLLGGDARVDPVSLVFYRFLIGSAAILGYAAWRKESLRFRSLREFMQMLAVAFFMLFLMSLLFFIGQQTASAITAALFLESGPAIIAIVWKLIRRHPTERREILAVGCGLLGCMFVLNMISMRGFHYGFASWLGQLALIGSAVSWVIGSAIGRKLMAAPNRVVLMGYCELASAVMVIPFLLIFHSQLIIPAGWGTWGAIVLLGLVPTAAAFIAWSEAMPRVPLWKLGLLQNLSPVFTLLGAWLFLGEHLSFYNILGIILVLAGLRMASPPPPKGRRSAGRHPQ